MTTTDTWAIYHAGGPTDPHSLGAGDGTVVGPAGHAVLVLAVAGEAPRTLGPRALDAALAAVAGWRGHRHGRTVTTKAGATVRQYPGAF